MFYWLGLLCVVARLQLSLSGQENSFESVPDLEKSMYVAIDGYPCVRLLNISGEIGCSNPGRGNVVAPVVRFKDTIKLAKQSAILTSLEEFDSFFTRFSSDPDFAKHVAGMLVESGTQSTNELKGFSPDKKFPLVEFAPYNSGNFEWNPTGSGVMWEAYNFPVFLLSESSTLTLREVAIKNEKRKNSYTSNVVDFDLVMQTTKSGTRDSESCLRQQTCLPLGGYSVWSALPPINLSSEKSRPVILAVASMDSSSFFRDRSIGADSPISGLISLLAAVDALSRVDYSRNFIKQLVFVVFTGESWGYLGSRRFLLELDQHSDAVRGLDFSKIETVLEIGSVGKSTAQDVTTFFAHTTGGAYTNETLNALFHAQDSLKTQNIKISKAKKSNPGLPPSSLMAFVRKNPQTSGIVLEDFDDAYRNKFYHSHLDDQSNVNSSAIVAAASLVARSLYILASDKKEVNASLLTTINANSSLVEELLGCLLSCEPGLSCGLVKSYIAPSMSCPSHYVGVILGEPSSVPYLGNVGDVSRFIWNFLAEKTSIRSTNTSSACPKDCGRDGEACIQTETDGKGICVISTTRYVPAYSTRLKYESDTWMVLPSNSTEPDPDPVWTESNWDMIRLRAYTVQGASYDRFLLLLGIVVTVLAYLIIVMTRAFITKAMKCD
ncbi:PREDICTED: nicastrin isoform X2 [Ipomoea nil]|uniref:nicastrin isoform X2 n=1 Tax=Ipomoea nil TaxID=35883 RepID=UPI000900DD21|nr:PREDICTED: nicastrin isoform X2 [Ipomoea nil]